MRLSSKFNKVFSNLNVLSDKQTVVAGLRKADLAAFVRRRLEDLGLTHRSAADKTHGAVNYSTIYNLANGKNEDVGIVTLMNLSRALSCSVFELVEVALGEKAELALAEQHLVHLFRLLSPSRQRDLTEMAETWIKRESQLSDQSDTKEANQPSFPTIEKTDIRMSNQGKAPKKLSRKKREDLSDVARDVEKQAREEGDEPDT